MSLARRGVVTGGTKGIGFAIARALVAAGSRVMITGRDEARVSQAVAKLRASIADDGAIEGRVADVRDRAAIERAIGDAAAVFGSLDTLVNNAGIGVFRPIDALTDADWHSVIDTNLTGAFYATRAVVPLMKKAGGGWIINIASLAGRYSSAEGAAYCASKAALVAFSESVMMDVRADNIRVSCIMPGSVATEFSRSAGRDDESWKLTGDDIAEVVVDLLRHPARSLPSRIEIRPAKTKADR
jgi:NADP-dependent 3-hydroxy acid dehydrogenase YdfG